MATPRVGDIADLELFAGCTKAELRKIRALTTYVQVPRDQVLMREGSAAHEFIIIDSGTARVSRATGDGVAKVADVPRQFGQRVPVDLADRPLRGRQGVPDVHGPGGQPRRGSCRLIREVVGLRSGGRPALVSR
jgi:hypothetical protein